MTNCLLGLGSNLNAPRRQLILAIQHIKNLPQTIILETAPFFRNPAWGKKGLPDYYNTVTLINTRLSPFDLLQYCQAIEKKQRRVRSVKNAARTLDIDLLEYGSLRLNHPNLQLPHPHMHEREFVQIPLKCLHLDGQSRIY